VHNKMHTATIGVGTTTVAQNDMCNANTPGHSCPKGVLVSTTQRCSMSNCPASDFLSEGTWCCPSPPKQTCAAAAAAAASVAASATASAAAKAAAKATSCTTSAVWSKPAEGWVHGTTKNCASSSCNASEFGDDTKHCCEHPAAGSVSADQACTAAGATKANDQCKTAQYCKKTKSARQPVTGVTVRATAGCGDESGLAARVGDGGDFVTETACKFDSGVARGTGCGANKDKACHWHPQRLQCNTAACNAATVGGPWSVAPVTKQQPAYTCTNRGAAGSTCGAGGAKECASFLQCTNGANGAKTCQRRAISMGPGNEGLAVWREISSCALNTDCKSGNCKDVYGSTSTVTAKKCSYGTKAKGADCRIDWQQCGEGYCKPSQSTLGGTCTKRLSNTASGQEVECNRGSECWSHDPNSGSKSCDVGTNGKGLTFRTNPDTQRHVGKGVCKGRVTGSSCLDSEQCDSNMCDSGYCVLVTSFVKLNSEGSCVKNTQCASGTCALKNVAATSKTCVGKATGVASTTPAGCISGYHERVNGVFKCAKNTSFTAPAVAHKGKCFRIADCASNVCTYTGAGATPGTCTGIAMDAACYGTQASPSLASDTQNKSCNSNLCTKRADSTWKCGAASSNAATAPRCFASTHCKSGDCSYSSGASSGECRGMALGKQCKGKCAGAGGIVGRGGQSVTEAASGTVPKTSSACIAGASGANRANCGMSNGSNCVWTAPGTAAESHAKCASGMCDTSGAFTCHRFSSNVASPAVCSLGINCASGICSSNGSALVCVGKADGVSCSDGNVCASGLCEHGACVSRSSDVASQASCTLGINCSSSTCTANACVGIVEGATCALNSQCDSGLCCTSAAVCQSMTLKCEKKEIGAKTTRASQCSSNNAAANDNGELQCIAAQCANTNGTLNGQACTCPGGAAGSSTTAGLTSAGPSAACTTTVGLKCTAGLQGASGFNGSAATCMQ